MSLLASDKSGEVGKQRIFPREAVAPGEMRRALSNQNLHLIMMPTEACNFRCVYCYEEFRHKTMLPHVVQGVKRLLERRAPDLRSLSLSWFGGEPLLARRVIEDVMLSVRALAPEHPRLSVRSDMTTNGWLLTESVFARLLELGVSEYQITFDGTRAFHDRKRIRADGKGSFDRIWGNLLALRAVSAPFSVTVRLHLSRENVPCVDEFLDEYGAAFQTDSRFELFIRGLARLGGPNDESLPVFGDIEGKAVIEVVRHRARARGLKLLKPGPSDSICYAARGNSFVIRADGRLNKCTVALEHPGNQVGRIHEDGTLEVAPARMVMWMRGLHSGNPVELQCPMLGYAETVRADDARPADEGSTCVSPAPSFS